LDGREVHKVRLPKEVNALDLPIGRGEVVDIDVTVPSNTKIIFSVLVCSDRLRVGRGPVVLKHKPTR